MIIKLEDIWMEYNGEYVLKNINMKIDQGDYIIIRGVSGAGKTSLLRVIGLISQPSKGNIYFLDRKIDRNSFKEKTMLRARYYGLMIQGEELIDTLNIYENIDITYALKEKDKKVRRKKIEYLLEKFNILNLKDKYPGELSQGEKQRVYFIRAIIKEPKILLLDEPYSGLDDTNRKLIYREIEDLNKKGTTVILTTTELYSNREYKGRNYLLVRGELREL